MMRKFLVSGMVVALAATAACTDLMSSRQAFQRPDLSAAYYTIPVAYSTTQSTYDASAEGTGAFMPHMDRGGMGHGPGPDMGGGMGPMMGGGMGMDFMGGPGLGREFGRGPFGDPALNTSNCTFSSSTGRLTCTPDTDRNGLTITRSIAFTTAAGVAQSAFDSLTTNSINTRITVAGTVTHRDSATSTISNSSDRTVTGVAKGSTRRTINGTAAGSETTTGKDSAGAFTARRTAADSIRGVVVPVDTGRTYPIAGTVVRVMNIAVTHSTGTTNSARREVVTYDGSATAKMVVTIDGTTKTCTIPLPFGRPTCQ
jgi:hypothetical protein